MVPPPNLEKIAGEGFKLLDQWKGRKNKTSSVPYKSTQKEVIDCNQAAKMHGGVVFTQTRGTKYAYMPWNKALSK